MSLKRIGTLEFTAGSQKFNFRPLEKADREQLVKFAQRNQGIINGPFPVTTEALTRGHQAAQKWIDEKTEQAEDEKSLICVIEQVETGRIVGYLSAFLFDWRVPKCEIAWMVDTDFQRKGIATTCCKALFHFLTDDCDLQKMVCRIDPKNTASIVLAQNLGFQQEGIHKKDFRDGFGRLIDVVYFAYFPE